MEIKGRIDSTHAARIVATACLKDKRANNRVYNLIIITLVFVVVATIVTIDGFICVCFHAILQVIHAHHTLLDSASLIYRV